MVGFDEALAQIAIPFREIQIARLATSAVKFLGPLSSRAIALNPSMESIPADFDDSRIWWKYEFSYNVRWALRISINPSAIGERTVCPCNHLQIGSHRLFI